ncbi:MAG TPA: OmpH family outer membrane protein [Sphingomonas sp.]|nr:OmpH family outer membrane protein [Sphingomonas sp.]
MKTIFKLSAAAVLLAATVSPAMSAVLTVDFSRVFSESAAGKSGNTQLHAKYDAPMQQRNTAFNTAVQAYNTQAGAVQAIKPPAQATPAQINAARQAGERAQAAQDALSQLDQEVQTVGRYVQSQIVEKVTPIAEQIRAERKADVVVPKGSVLAADPTADVTTLVIQRLDASFPNPSITLPQQPAPAAGAGR